MCVTLEQVKKFWTEDILFPGLVKSNCDTHFNRRCDVSKLQILQKTNKTILCLNVDNYDKQYRYKCNGLNIKRVINIKRVSCFENCISRCLAKLSAINLLQVNYNDEMCPLCKQFDSKLLPPRDAAASSIHVASPSVLNILSCLSHFTDGEARSRSMQLIYMRVFIIDVTAGDAKT